MSHKRLGGTGVGPFAILKGGATIKDDDPVTSRPTGQVFGTTTNMGGSRTSPWSGIALTLGDGGISMISRASEGGARGVPSSSSEPWVAPMMRALLTLQLAP